jgi:hypothetical protein
MYIALTMVPVHGFDVQRFPSNLNLSLVFTISECKTQV